ncbi:phosphatidylinositol glycan anchor biosynthesis class U protein [Drosophila pseudoobscura]|uniref:Phosphatidylinositol glycan anchor biosynthesis class U protein n=1 Tax=Drosophila pseudoobscura pseudoobscura TaxID=46245 RepID=A0A6I8UXK2_DROPS|nr:phosphatidylinositol glycan anchor biosynthesis class U protein [Drosophila pseudoobscura]
MDAKFYKLILLGGAVRFYFVRTPLASLISDRVEFATPLNSQKRMKEGIYLLDQGIDPYSGDLVHETPLVLKALSGLFLNFPQWLPLIYIMLDLLTGALLYNLSVRFVKQKLQKQCLERKNYAKDTEQLQYNDDDNYDIPELVLIAYLFNPLTVLSCIGLTSTVLSNLFLALFLYFLTKGLLLPCIFLLAFETVRSFYPIVLMAPLLLVFARRSFAGGVILSVLFAVACLIIAAASYLVIESWSFLEGTLGFIFYFRDLQPNIGLFWYFFTEMFEHFRTMFLITFQLNATVLYLVPLSLKLRKEPLLLATVLVALMAVFRAYPSLGDVGFYLALLPLWKRCWKYMAHGFVVFTFFLVTLSMMGTLWHLWIYAGSANANFYFGATLAFSTGQIFLITDLLFAHVKREFCLYNGQKIMIDGEEARILLK